MKKITLALMILTIALTGLIVSAADSKKTSPECQSLEKKAKDSCAAAKNNCATRDGFIANGFKGNESYAVQGVFTACKTMEKSCDEDKKALTQKCPKSKI